MTREEQYDDAMFDFSSGDFNKAITKLKAILAEDPTCFDAQLSLGMAYYRQGDFAAAIAEGHKAETLKPKEQLVHTNLSLFYMKAGDKKTAEHHGLQARIASWREDKSTPGTAPAGDPRPRAGQGGFTATRPAGKIPRHAVEEKASSRTLNMQEPL